MVIKNTYVCLKLDNAKEKKLEKQNKKFRARTVSQGCLQTPQAQQLTSNGCPWPRLTQRACKEQCFPWDSLSASSIKTAMASSARVCSLPTTLGIQPCCEPGWQDPVPWPSNGHTNGPAVGCPTLHNSSHSYLQLLVVRSLCVLWQQLGVVWWGSCRDRQGSCHHQAKFCPNSLREETEPDTERE